MASVMDGTAKEDGLNFFQDIVADTVGKPIEDIRQGKFLEGAAGLAGLFTKPAAALLTPSTAEAASNMELTRRAAGALYDWFKGGKPTVNVPTKKLQDLVRSGKLKNQMELTNNPRAWQKRVEVEKALAGIPRPYSSADNALRNELKALQLEQKEWGFVPELHHRINDLKESLKWSSAYNPQEAAAHPVYGHIYNPAYTNKNTAGMFGDSYLEMSDKVKDNALYVLGDSFDPLVNKVFSAADMAGNTSKLEQALFPFFKRSHTRGNIAEMKSELNEFITNPQQYIPYIEMWIPNRMSTLNNVNSIHTPAGSHSVQSLKNDPRVQAMVKYNEPYKTVSDVWGYDDLPF